MCVPLEVWIRYYIRWAYIRQAWSTCVGKSDNWQLLEKDPVRQLWALKDTAKVKQKCILKKITSLKKNQEIVINYNRNNKWKV